MDEVKCVVVGDGNVVECKTCMLISYTSNEFPTQYVPTIFDIFSMTVISRKTPYSLRLFDTAGQEDYDKLRPLSYPRTDVFLLCFAIDAPDTYRNVTTKWAPEIQHYQPHTPFLVVGTKADLRDDPETKERLAKSKQRPIKPEEGSQLAKDLKAVCYIECSAKTQGNLSLVFDQAVIAATKPKRKSKQSKCSIL